jgi:hypothetical protein
VSTTRIADVPVIDPDDLDHGAISYQYKLQAWMIHASLLCVLKDLKRFSLS